MEQVRGKKDEKKALLTKRLRRCICPKKNRARILIRWRKICSNNYWTCIPQVIPLVETGFQPLQEEIQGEFSAGDRVDRAYLREMTPALNLRLKDERKKSKLNSI